LLANWGRGGDQVVSGTSNYSLLSTYSAKLSNGSIALLAVNKHPSSDLTAQITLTGFTTGTTPSAYYTYGKTNDLALTGLTSGTFVPASSTFTYTFPSYSMTVLVVKPAGLPVFTTGTAPVVVADNQFDSYQIIASGTPTGYGASGLPPGLVVNGTNGLISGTSTMTGTFTVTLSATDSVGSSTSLLTIVVSAANGVPALRAWAETALLLCLFSLGIFSVFRRLRSPGV